MICLINSNRFNISIAIVLISILSVFTSCEKEDLKVSGNKNETVHYERAEQPGSLLFYGMLVYDVINSSWECVPGPYICFMVVFKETENEADLFIPDENNSFEESIPNPIGVFSFNTEETEMTYSEIEDVLTFDQINETYTAYTIDTVDNVSYLNTLTFTLDL